MDDTIKILDPGVFATIQDLGRVGYREYGVPLSGVMDQTAAKLANRLVGNPAHFPVIEFTLKGGSFKVLHSATIAITGADLKATLNEMSLERNQSINVQAGDIVKMNYARSGVRSYLAIAGEWDIEKVMESYSTFVPGHFGGFNGQTLKGGDVISVKEPSTSELKLASPNEIPYYSHKLTVELLPGPEFEYLSKDAIELLTNTEFSIQPQSNRMGIRLASDIPLPTPNLELKSSGVVPGVIQLPPSGQPIILMRDAQTVGGYPRIAKVREHYLDPLAQMQVGSVIRFKISN